ncbi:MAG: triacylglycerol lipase [Rhodocyclaceae bacterium]|nr:triacylglycerol lipase [Rhodocyclaceae bacterium]MBK6907302.1 triacylglycerol lipase [Rhodocyclaceae bacterium]
MKPVLRNSVLALTACFSLGQPAFAETGYTKTKYPILLVHGLFGFDNILGADYFYGVRDTLAREGAVVFQTSVSATQSNEVRGEQLVTELKRLKAQLGNSPTIKFNLIGHSQGSPTARYAAAKVPELVASVTSVGGVNRGAKIADVVRGTIAPGSVSESVANAASAALTKVLGVAAGTDLSQSGVAALNSLTTAGSAVTTKIAPDGVPTPACPSTYSLNDLLTGTTPAFTWNSGNAAGSHISKKGIHYYSWIGISTVTNVLDPVDGGVGVVSLVYGKELSDGIVGACSQVLGKVVGAYKMNHLDEVNMSFGLTHLFEVNPKTVYRKHVNFLKGKGL